MKFSLNPKHLIKFLSFQYTLKILFCVILLQASVLHHSDHNIQLDSPCLVCFSQTNLDTGVIVDETQLDVVTPVFEIFSSDLITFNSQAVAWFRSRSPPRFS